MSDIETSIILRTFNEERYLPDLLEAFRAQRYQNFEIINVDSGSYDRTTEIAERYDARILKINSRDFTFGYSLNVGIEAAVGQFMVIVSAHTRPADDMWLEKLISPLRQDNFAMVYGRQLGVDTSKYGETRDLERTFGPNRRILKPPYFFANNANSAIQRHLWEEHNFDAGLPGQEDIEWAKHWMERGYNVQYEPDAKIYHIHRETWRQVRRRYYREALATRSIGVWGRRDIVPLGLREAGYLGTDFVDAFRKRQLTARAREIVWFRANKGFGTIAGLLDGEAMENSVERDALFFDRKCSAVVVHSPNHASLDEIDIPVTRPGDVLIEVGYAGVTNADLGMLSGEVQWQGTSSPNKKLIPGHELSGWVAKTGVNVTNLKVGDPVVVQQASGCGSCVPCKESVPARCQNLEASELTGAYAEYSSVPGRYVHKLPAEVDLKSAVLCQSLAVILKGLRKLDSLIGQQSTPISIAIVGAGPIGHLCARVLSMREHRVTVFDRNPKRLRCFENTPISISSEMDGLDRYDVVVEASGDPEALQQIIEESAPGAVVLLLGLPYSRRPFTIQGGNGSDKTVVWSVGAEPSDFEEAIRLLPELPTDSLTECEFPLPQFNEAWETFRRGDHLKVLLKVS